MKWYYLVLAIFFGLASLTETYEGHYTMGFYAFVLAIAFLAVGTILKIHGDKYGQD